MFDIAYAAVVLVGALTLIAEATRQFSKPADAETHDRYPILRGVELSSLSTSTEYIRGYVLYVLVYLAIYAAFIVSTELFSLLKAATSGQKIAGATGDITQGEGTQDLFTNQGYGKPIFISAAMIFALSIGIFSRVEVWIRSFAHYLAGIPRGVYRVITKLNRIDYHSMAHPQQLPLSRTFEENVVRHLSNSVKNPMICEIQSSLRIIDILSPSVIGQYSTQIWPSRNVSTLNNLIEKLKSDLTVLTTKTQEFTDNLDALEELHQLVLDARNNLQALFAVLFIRNKDIVLPSGHNPTAKIIRTIRRERLNNIAQCLAGAVLITLILSVFSYVLIDILYNFFKSAKSEQNLFQIFQSELRPATIQAVWFALKFGCFFGIAGALAISVRGNLIDIGRWDAWRPRQTPFLRFLRAAVFPALASVLAVIVLELIREIIVVYIASGSIVSSSYVGDFFKNGIIFYLLLLVFAVLISFYMFIVADVHNRISAYKTVLIAVSFSILIFAWALISVSITYGNYSEKIGVDLFFVLKEALNYFSISFVFFVTYSILIEITED